MALTIHKEGNMHCQLLSNKSLNEKLKGLTEKKHEARSKITDE